jgi:S-adenosyl-L-methionine hydrolase (adenosine-forming)
VSRPLVALLTDFGTGGPYVAAMKGVMLGICRDLDFLDISHEVRPHDIIGAGAILMATVPYLPAGTVIVAVVDPGVGTARRALAARAGGHVFVGPDNGVLAPVLDALGPDELVSIENPRFARPSTATTFEGRDRFGPAAAWIACGTALGEFGPPVAVFTRERRPEPRAAENTLEGEVVWVDRFGNLVTNISRSAWLREAAGRSGDVLAGGRSAGSLLRTYAEAAPGALCPVFGSTDQLEVAVREGSAAETLGLGPGAPVTVVWR